MKSFGIPIVVVSLLGLCLVWGLGGSPAYADLKFGEAVNLGPMVNSGSNEFGAKISPDGLELYFSSDRPGGYGSYDIWVAKRASAEDPWGPPSNLGPKVNSAGPGVDEIGSISSDGLTLYYQSWGQVYTTTRATKDSPWKREGNLTSSLWLCMRPVVSADGLELFVSKYLDGGAQHISVSTRATTADAWGPPVNLSVTANTSSQEWPLWLSPDGLTMLFASNPPTGFGNYDTYVMTRPSRGSAWGTPRNLGRSFNSPSSEAISSTSADGRLCYFDDWEGPRPGGLGGYDIWQAPIEPIVDFNHDGKVDIKDLVRLTESWGKNDPAVDIGPMPWGDGRVDASDLEVLMSHWGENVEIYDPTLIAHWTFDESEGSVATDSIILNEAKLSGPTWQPAGGKIGGALQFDGIDDYAETIWFFDPTQTAFSIFAWVKGGGPGQVIVSQKGKVNWLALDANTGCLMTQLAGSGGNPLQSQAVVADGNWHEVGFTWDWQHVVLYMDGVAVAQSEQTKLSNLSSTFGLYFGQAAAIAKRKGSFWCGLIDDVRVHNQAVKP
jgi:Tol biopolymer transport system component